MTIGLPVGLRTGFGLAAAAMVVACSAPQADRGRTETIQAESGAERLALALAAAESALADGDRTRLGDAIRLVDATGARPLASATNDPVADWRELVPDAAAPMRGRPLGPGYRDGRLQPGGSERIEQLFLSGVRATIALAGAGETDLDLEVTDSRRQPVCARDAGQRKCRWVPVFTQRYSIEISNRGTRPARYFLVIE